MGKGQIIAIIAAIVLVVVLYFLPRTPEAEGVEAPIADQEVVPNELDEKVNRAIEIINSQEESPMEAITLLREVLQEDSNHVAANFWLGEFSMMSGQYEKAVQRFEKVLRLDPDNVDVCLKLAKAFEMSGDIESAQRVLNDFSATHPQKEILEQIEAVRKEISVKP